jgi:hypothetical protein
MSRDPSNSSRICIGLSGLRSASILRRFMSSSICLSITSFGTGLTNGVVDGTVSVIDGSTRTVKRRRISWDEPLVEARSAASPFACDRYGHSWHWHPAER